MITYNIEASICEALNLPRTYYISDQEYLSEHRILQSTSLATLPPGCSFSGMAHTEQTKIQMSKTMSDGRRKKPKTIAWKNSRSKSMKGKLQSWIPRKRVIYNGIEYPSIKHAAIANNVHRRIIRKNATLISHE